MLQRSPGLYGRGQAAANAEAGPTTAAAPPALPTCCLLLRAPGCAAPTCAAALASPHCAILGSAAGLLSADRRPATLQLSCLALCCCTVDA